MEYSLVELLGRGNELRSHREPVFHLGCEAHQGELTSFA